VASRDIRDDPAGFTEVLTAWSWWDLPHEGVVRMDGRPHRFCCEFDEALDDYPDEYRVWPITEDELAADLARWAVWVAWRRRFDQGENPPPFEKDPSSQSLRWEADSDARSASARLVIAEWRLDPDGSFAARTPRHLVRFVCSDDLSPEAR
jgi:hypothetical protein